MQDEDDVDNDDDEYDDDDNEDDCNDYDDDCDDDYDDEVCAEDCEGQPCEPPWRGTALLLIIRQNDY